LEARGGRYSFPQKGWKGKRKLVNKAREEKKPRAKFQRGPLGWKLAQSVWGGEIELGAQTKRPKKKKRNPHWEGKVDQGGECMAIVPLEGAFSHFVRQGGLVRGGGKQSSVGRYSVRGC